MHRTTIMLPDGLDVRLTAAARLRKTSRTEVIRLALDEFLGREVWPRPRSVGAGHGDGQVSSETIKDLYREHIRRMSW